MPEPEAPSATRSSPASAAARALLRGFASAGVQHVVVCAGSRSQALALAAAELADAGALTLTVRLDERSAGFVALGIGMETGRPALVVTTSGTAVANLHPAVLEAHHAGVPLIALTADRPEELRGIRANQTTVQPGIFGTAVRLEADVAAPEGAAGEADAASELARRAVAVAADPRHPGPVHLNLQYREPLSGPAAEHPVAEDPTADGRVAEPDEAPPGVATAVIEHGPRTVVVAGAGAGERAEEVARAGGWPLIAEVSSGAHFGPNLVVAYRELLREPDFGGAVERVLVFGHPTLSREVPALVQRVEAIVVHPGGGDRYDPGHAVDRFVEDVAVARHEPDDADRRWLGRWVSASRSMLDEASVAPPRTSGVVLGGHVGDFAAQREYVRTEFEAIRAPITRRMLVEALWRATWPHDRLLLGASRLIRDADRSVPGKRVLAYASRGLAGIDGSVSTALGIAIARPEPPGTVRALLGDLTLLHDAGAMLIGSAEARPRVLIVVGNDGGGTIFDALEVAGSARAEAFDRVLYTPQQADLAALAAAYGWEYRSARTAGELGDALTAHVTGPTLLEVPLPR